MFDIFLYILLQGSTVLYMLEILNMAHPGEDQGGWTTDLTWLHCPKTSERNFNLGVLNLYEIHFMALLSVKYPYPVSNVLLHRI
jgi:hypothetical protein